MSSNEEFQHTVQRGGVDWREERSFNRCRVAPLECHWIISHCNTKRRLSSNLYGTTTAIDGQKDIRCHREGDYWPWLFSQGLCSKIGSLWTCPWPIYGSRHNKNSSSQVPFHTLLVIVIGSSVLFLPFCRNSLFQTHLKK